MTYKQVDRWSNEKIFKLGVFKKFREWFNDFIEQIKDDFQSGRVLDPSLAMTLGSATRAYL